MVGSEVGRYSYNINYMVVRLRRSLYLKTFDLQFLRFRVGHGYKAVVFFHVEDSLEKSDCSDNKVSLWLPLLECIVHFQIQNSGDRVNEWIENRRSENNLRVGVLVIVRHRQSHGESKHSIAIQSSS